MVAEALGSILPTKFSRNEHLSVKVRKFGTSHFFYKRQKKWLVDVLAWLADFMNENVFQLVPYHLSIKYQLAFLDIYNYFSNFREFFIFFCGW